MKMFRHITSLLLVPLAHAVTLSSAVPTFLQAGVTATNANNESVIECWQFTNPVTIVDQPGLAGAAAYFFNNTANMSYAVIPPRSDGGLHNAPVLQIVVVLSGLIYVRTGSLLSNNTSVNQTYEAYIGGGQGGLLIAQDIHGPGHYTSYPSYEPTVVLQIPFASPNDLPPYAVAHEGACATDFGTGQLVA